MSGPTDNSGASAVRDAVAASAEQLHSPSDTCDNLVADLFAEFVDVLSPEQILEAIRQPKEVTAKRCLCLPLSASMLVLGVLASREAEPGGDEPMASLGVFEGAFRECRCAECQLSGRVGGPILRPPAEHCRDAAIDGVTLVLEMGAARGWL